MDFDFALLLVVLTFVTGVVWLFDRLFLARGRDRRAEALASVAAADGAERDRRVAEARREPVPVEYARSFFPVLLAILVIRSFIAEPFKIPSGSMMPTLQVGDFILVNKFAYGLRLPVLNTKFLGTGEPKRGDVMVFRYPKNPKEDYIKRVVGLPGDEITYRNKTLYVNGEKVVDTRVGPYTGPPEPGRPMYDAQVYSEQLGAVRHDILEMPLVDVGHEGTWRVPPDAYFAMGDNRDNSADSRFWGFVPEQNLVGRAFVIWLNCSGWFCMDRFEFRRIGTLIE
ncbi:MAG: signal peptidase I [Lysobacterales bacterium]